MKVPLMFLSGSHAGIHHSHTWANTSDAELMSPGAIVNNGTRVCLMTASTFHPSVAQVLESFCTASLKASVVLNLLEVISSVTYSGWFLFAFYFNPLASFLVPCNHFPNKPPACGLMAQPLLLKVIPRPWKAALEILKDIHTLKRRIWKWATYLLYGNKDALAGRKPGGY